MRRSIFIMALIIGLLSAGCSTMQGWFGTVVDVATNNVTTITNLVEVYKTTGDVRRAVVVSLTAVDPIAYQGWAGDCPGTDVDGDVFAELCKEQGLDVVRLANEQATKQDMLDACTKATADMTNGGLFVLFISGHGGQVPDLNGDEDDGMDETLVMWDGELTDDVMCELWQKLPAGVRVFFVSDTCNSGSNFRAKPISARSFVPRNYTGQLIHFGGCADGKSSMGSASGGQFTTALVDGWDPKMSYKEWYRASSAKMPLDQVPAYAEYGNVTASFRDAKAFR